MSRITSPGLREIMGLIGKAKLFGSAYVVLYIFVFFLYGKNRSKCECFFIRVISDVLTFYWFLIISY